MILCLDYDNCTHPFLWSEIKRLKYKYDIVFQVWQTSSGSYHLRSESHLTEEQAWAVMDDSRCSTDYKEMCFRHGYMPFRVSGKINVSSSGEETYILAPKLLFTI